MRNLTLLGAAMLAVSAQPLFAPDTGDAGGGLPLTRSDGEPVPLPSPVEARTDIDKARAKVNARGARKPKPDADGLVEATVRRGTVVAGTFDKPITVGPGGKVRLTPEEVARMREDGILEDPDAAELPEWKGPSVSAG